MSVRRALALLGSSSVLFACSVGSSDDRSRADDALRTHAPAAASASYTLTITSPEANASVSGSIDVVGIASGFLDVEVHSADGTLLAQATPDGNGNFSASVDTTQLADGSQTLNIDAWDSAGGTQDANHASVPLTLDVNNAAPVPQPPPPTPAPPPSPAFESGIYPQGARFPLVVLAFDPPDAAAATASGWNVAHTYYLPWWTTSSVAPSFVNSCAAGQLLALGSLAAADDADGMRSALSEDDIAAAIADLSATGHVPWWDLPEELRYWKPTEMAVVQSYTSFTRLYDPNKSPNSMYIPSHYGTAALQEYVPYLDILPVSAYTTYAAQPHAWVRWRVESAVHAIENAGFTIGRDYLAGQKTPVAYLELYTGSTGITPEGSYHDFWQAIVSGARGLLVYSYAYKDSSATLTACWQRLSDAALELTGPENLEEAILYGTRQAGLSVAVLSGPARTPSFEADDASLDYPAVDVLGVTYAGELFVIAVNSATEAVTATIAGSPSGAASADVLFEGRTIPAASGAWQDDFEPLGVHIYRQALF